MCSLTPVQFQFSRFPTNSSEKTSASAWMNLYIMSHLSSTGNFSTSHVDFLFEFVDIFSSIFIALSHPLCVPFTCDWIRACIFGIRTPTTLPDARRRYDEKLSTLSSGTRHKRFSRHEEESVWPALMCQSLKIETSLTVANSASSKMIWTQNSLLPQAHKFRLHITNLW